MAETSEKTWYVSYVVTSSAQLPHRTHRATRTFNTELEAKNFAKTKCEAGDKTLIAGTINPFLPKRVIPSASITSWIYDEA